jgi:1,4-alpha-glucan branching enzyme
MNQLELTDFDFHLFAEGTHSRIYEKLGAKLCTKDDKPGALFRVWAPNAKAVSVIGTFNDWHKTSHPMNSLGGSGIWETFIPGIKQGTLYKYAIVSNQNDFYTEKADPYGIAAEIRPATASKVWQLDQTKWNDEQWMAKRHQHNNYKAPISIYEVHLGSWMRVVEEDNRMLTYRELADKLVSHLEKTNFTHVELLPIAEHPFDGSWGYQVVGYFAPTSRFGTPDDFIYFVNKLHNHNIGVIIDWVPAHFPRDGHGLSYFDGTHLYEHADPRKGEHQDWGTHIFNYGRSEVSSFLTSNAMYWFDKFHIDGLRVDAVASMLYLDYSRPADAWVPNYYGGRENLEAITFLKRLNELVYRDYPDIMMIAEESTSWPMVSRPVDSGGLGFGFKWDMGWMHDTLKYLQFNPIHRAYHHGTITFRMIYGFSENYILPLSHDEVVHEKCSIISKMPGDRWQQFANTRLLYAYMYFLPGKKLLFMGNEIGQWREWDFASSIDWHLLEFAEHQGLYTLISDLNKLYRSEHSLFEADCEGVGFQWICQDNSSESVLSWLRKSPSTGESIVIVSNFTPVPRHNFQVGVPENGAWKELLNSDATIYAGSGLGNFGEVQSLEIPYQGFNNSLFLMLPPLSVLALKVSKE